MSIAIDILTLFLKVFLVHFNRNLHAVRINQNDVYTIILQFLKRALLKTLSLCFSTYAIHMYLLGFFCCKFWYINDVFKTWSSSFYVAFIAFHVHHRLYKKKPRPEKCHCSQRQILAVRLRGQISEIRSFLTRTGIPDDTNSS